MKLVLTKNGKINSETRKFSWWKTRKVEDLYYHVMNKTEEIITDSWGERLYCFSKEMKQKPNCCVCGNSIKIFYTFGKGYANTCSRVCSNKSPERAEKIKRTFSSFTKKQRKEFLKKIRDGFFKKYGVDNISKTQHFKDAYKKAMNRNYGVDNYFKMTDKIKESFLSIYGHDNPQQVDEIKQRTIKTVKRKYGKMLGACPAKQTKKTCMKRFGVEYFFASDAGKMNEINLRERYGWTDDELLELRKSKNSMSLSWAISKTNNIEEAKRLHIERIKSVTIRFGKASQESLKVFIPLYKNLRKNKVNRNEIWFGVNGSKERYLIDPNYNTMYFYDFCVITPALKFIIEYNGVTFHPKSTIQEGWKHPFDSTQTVNKCFNHDQAKKQLAIDSGYDYLTLWSDNSKLENIRIATDFIEDRL